MASRQMTLTGKPDYSPPPVDGDFYRIAQYSNEGSGRCSNVCANSRKVWSRR